METGWQQHGASPAGLKEDSMTPIRILMVDDSPDFLESASRFLSADPQFEVVGRANSGILALAMAAELRPDLVLMDWAMPEMPGPVAMRHLKLGPQPPRVIILTMYDLPEYRAIAKLAFADGFLAKSDFGEKLQPMIYSLFSLATVQQSI
jgi:DNA-binding NarL/FixJ family response regulator